MNIILVKMPNLRAVRKTDVFNSILLLCLIMLDDFLNLLCCIQAERRIGLRTSG